MQRWIRLFSRISLRLLAFNLLLVFLPLAALLFLQVYEQRLEDAEQRAMLRESQFLAAELSEQPSLYGVHAQRILEALKLEDMRVRVVDRDGFVLADNGLNWRHEAAQEGRSEARRNWLYRAATFVFRWPAQFFRPPEQPLPSADFYESARRLTGVEIQAALGGKKGFTKRTSPGGERSVTLYAATPIRQDGRVTGAVLVEQSTYPILQDIYEVRLGVLRIFLASLALAVVLTLLIATTIVRPLHRLRLEANAILDPRGRLRGRFRGSKKLDEIGDLSRALERLTRRLDSHQEFIESFAADVSHEFRNPLASIRTATETLAQLDDPAERRRFLDMVERDIARMEHLLSAVRRVTQIDATLASEERSAVDLGELLSHLTDGFRMRSLRSVALELELPERPVVVETAEDRLAEVFDNLLDNAESFSPPGTAVRVTLSSGEGEAEVRVADRGPGFPEGHLSRVFDRFFSYRPDHPPGDHHSGLGLAIVKAIVEGYEGSVEARNREGGGAELVVRLPLAGRDTSR
ncbi:MAG: ATP-binding protein [Thermoanaerobaculia bacterium]